MEYQRCNPNATQLRGVQASGIAGSIRANDLSIKHEISPARLSSARNMLTVDPKVPCDPLWSQVGFVLTDQTSSSVDTSHSEDG